MTDSTLPVTFESVPTAIRPTNEEPALNTLQNYTNSTPHPQPSVSPILTNPRHSTSTALAHPVAPTFPPRGGADRFLALASLACERTFAFVHRATSSLDIRPTFAVDSGAASTAAHSKTSRHKYTRSVDQTVGNKIETATIEATSIEPLDATRPLLDTQNELERISKLLEYFSTSTSRTSSSLAETHKMHQTSSRLLRMTEDDRPFTKDFKDLFSTLMVSLPLNNHRVRFKTYAFSFTSEEAIGNLGSLKFSQSNRMPDPKDPSRIVTTTTTTTFSMAKEMARSVCQRFMDARFIEPADGKPIPTFPLKGCTWVLTPKGIYVLDRFCQRNGINQDHVLKLLHSQYNTMRLVILERDPKTDKLSHDRNTIEVIFRRFSGSAPNIKTGSSMSSDSDSVSDYADGVTGVKLIASRKIYDRTVKNSFTGKDAVDWLLDCCTTVERKETFEICTLFVHYGLIQCICEDRVYAQQNPREKDFQASKNAIYIFTERGERINGWIESDRVVQNGEKTNGDPRDRETNTTRLTSILIDPALRLLFREYLRETVCEENLSFYLEVVEFDKNFKAIDANKPDAVRETLAAAYGLYNAFLAPGSPCELNIDHTLRQDMASRMTRAVARDDTSMYASLKDVATLFERAQQQVFKLMAGDSVPKFTRSPRYVEVAGDKFCDEDRHSPSFSGRTRNG